ncbi:Quinone oxidoreductase [Holothuria leucospilota]|uniref:Quinone oxidoreductase n=1 Tax=Holothuria leucospilota TaxID=206669 RepID=A0A9Q1BQN0_HOLLE|nr:Quinone oxidoreductase [Holothuria leucospilota]
MSFLKHLPITLLLVEFETVTQTNIKMTRTARASVIHEFGPEEILAPSDFPLPSVGPKQLLIRLKAFGINELELKIRAGKFRPYLFKRPFVLGMDGAGVVEEVGSDVTKFKVGVAAVQVAKGLGASRIIGTAGTEDGIKLALQHGADVVLNYKDKDFKESLQKEVGKGANIILETNADVNFDMDLDLVAKRGHIVDERQENADDIYKYCEEGWLKPYVGKVYKFSDIPQSHIDMANRKGAMGKVAVSLE